MTLSYIYIQNWLCMYDTCYCLFLFEIQFCLIFYKYNFFSLLINVIFLFFFQK